MEPELGLLFMRLFVYVTTVAGENLFWYRCVVFFALGERDRGGNRKDREKCMRAKTASHLCG
jgi:hypothetical protein